MPYRWAVLAAGTAAQASFSAIGIGLPVLAPALRDELGLSLAGVGVVLSAVWIGATLTLLPWGLLSDRIGERRVLAGGLAASALALAASAWADDAGALVALLVLAGAAGASVNAASGRVVMAWFGPAERGLAFGVRQTAIPIGGGIAALVLPQVEHAGGVGAAFLAMAGFTLATALAAGIVVRDRPREPDVAAGVPWTFADARLWRLCGASGFYLVAQVAVISFVVLFLHDERDLSEGEAGGVLAAIQVLAVGTRIGSGWWSDRLGARVPPLRLIGLAMCATLAAAAALTDEALLLVVVSFVLAGALSMAWNGLSFTAAAELAGQARSGAAIGFQQTALSVVGIGAPVAFAAAVTATSWQAAFGLAALSPLVGWWLLRPLAER